MHLSVRLTGAAALGAMCVAPVSGQHPPVPPTAWAITGARIEPVSGPAIATGTVVIRNGLITAVGTAVAVPADARVIDGTGLTVYPGFIDGYGTLGIPAAGGTPGGGGAAAAAQAAARRPSAPNSTYGAGLQPEVDAVTELEPTAAAFTAARGAGFTTALTAPGTGVFRGRSALISLRDGRAADLVLRNDVAQHIGFARGGGFGGGGGYPGSLMGVFAQLRQQLLDAQTWRDNQAVYARNPRGMARPAHDPSLAALQPVIAGTQPVVMFANTEREIGRALDLAREFGLRPIIAGGREAWKVTERLRSANVAVLLDIDFPRRTAPAGGRAAASTADDPPEAMRVLRDRVDMPQGAGKLAEAGVRFAMVSGGDFTDFTANVRRAVAAGLSRERALRAITLEPATLLGVADRLGTIEVGKIASLTIVSGDLFAEGGRVTQLFVEGTRYDLPAPAAGQGAGRGQ